MNSFRLFFTPRSIGQRFALAIGTGAALILIALALANYFSSREMLLQQASSEALQEVHDQIHSMDDLVDRMAMLPMAIGANQIANQASGGVTVPWLASLLEYCPIQAVYGLYMILDHQDWKNTEPFLWVNRKSWPSSARLYYDFHEETQNWYRGAKEKKGAIHVTKPYFAVKGSNIEMISITQAVYNRQGVFLGVAGADVALDEIQKIVKQMHIREFAHDISGERGSTTFLQKNQRKGSLEPHELAYLMTADGTLIVGPDVKAAHPSSTLETRESIRTQILATSTGWLRLKDGSGKVLYWAEGKRTGWKLILEIPYSMIIAPARTLAIESALIGGFGLLILLGTALVVAQRVSEPIRELQVVASHFEKNSYEKNNSVLERIGKRPDELGKFAKNFLSMAQKIRQREESLSQWSADLEITVQQRTSDLAEAMKDIEKTNLTMAAELAEAAAYAKAMLPQKLQGIVSTDWIFETSSQLGGDSFGYHWLDDDHFALYLLDVCGHGVGAALLSVSVVNLLRTSSLTKTDFFNPSSVLSSLNETFPMERHNDMYFTAWYGVYTHSTHQLCFACGGHPPALLITPDGAATKLSAQGVIVGAFPLASYERVTVEIPEGSRLLLFSDGVYEIDRPNQAMMSYDDFVEILKTSDTSHSLDPVITEVRRQQASNSFTDDFSLVEFHFLESKKTGKIYDLSLNADLSELSLLHDYLQAFGKKESLPESILFKLNVILEELATNTIKYGGIASGSPCCQIACSRNQAQLTIHFRDQGIPFNPLEQQEVDTNKKIEDRSIGGLGIHFVKKLTSSQFYARENHSNLLTMTISLEVNS
jgi:serine phosphatase RsbU (regulator of sigma subunit)/anti-sigma regulatory factor (Ser/Thr protein kinase)